MANNIKGITVEIGGNTGPLDKALKGINKTSRNLKSELKDVNRQLRLDPTNTTLLIQKQRLLAESVKNTKNKLDSLKEAERQAQQQFREGKITEEQYRALQREVTRTERQLKNLGNQASKSNATLSKISVTANKIGDSAGKVASGMAPATLAIGAAGIAAVKMGSDYDESVNKVSVAFKNNSKEIESWSETTLDKFGIASGTALDMSATFGDMATSMGFTTDKAAKMGEELVGRAGDLSSFKNISLDVAKTALNGVFSGETESLKQLGVVMTQANLQEYAYSNGIKKKIKDMTQAEQVQLRYSYVMDKTKNAAGDFARTADGTANSTRVLKESTKELSTTFGQQLIPMINPIIQKATQLIKQFSNLSSGTKRIILVILALIAAIAPVAKLIQGISIIVGAVTTVVGTVTGTIGLLTGSLTVATPAATALAGAITFITGPIGLTIIAVTALVAGFIYLWKHCEGFRNFWIGLWKGIKQITKSVVDSIVKFFTITIPGAWNSTVAFLKGIPAWVSSLWTSIKVTTEKIWNSIKSFFLGIWKGIITGTMVILRPFIKGITSLFNGIKKGLTTIFNGLKLYFKGIWNAIKLIFLGPILLICDLVTGNFKKLKLDVIKLFTGLKNAFSQIWQGIKQIFFGCLQAIAGYCSVIWNGIVNTSKTIWNGLANFLRGLWSGIISVGTSAWNGFKSIITNLISSAVQGAINIFNGLLNFFRSLPGTLYNCGVNMFNSMRSGINSTISGVRSAIVSGFNSAIEFLTSLPSKAIEWGKDFVDGLVSGITGSIGKVVDAVSALATKIRSYLHFSVPDEGPLTDYETWMPDFMEGLAAGIEKSKHLVKNAVEGLSTDMSVIVKSQDSKNNKDTNYDKDYKDSNKYTKEKDITVINKFYDKVKSPYQTSKAIKKSMRDLSFT